MPTDLPPDARAPDRATLRALLTPRGPSAPTLAFAAGAALVCALVSVVPPGWGSDQGALSRSGAVALALHAALAVAQGAVMALAVRQRSALPALVCLLAGCIVTPLALVLGQPALHAVARWAVANSCPPDVNPYGAASPWSPLLALLIAASFVPAALGAQAARASGAGDARARASWSVGAWLVAAGVAVTLPPAGAANALALAVAGTLLMAAARRDTRRRVRALSALASMGSGWVGAPSRDDPEGLRPLVTLPGALEADGVLRACEAHASGAYRAPRLREAVALYPLDVEAAAAALHGRVRAQSRWLVVATIVTALLAAAARGGPRPWGHGVHLLFC